MQRTIILALAISGVFMCLIGFGSSQITLSKGWGPGKRSVSDDTCKLTTKSMIAVCHTLVSELRRFIASCEPRGMSAYGQLGENIQPYQILYSNEVY